MTPDIWGRISKALEENNGVTEVHIKGKLKDMPLDILAQVQGQDKDYAAELFEDTLDSFFCQEADQEYPKFFVTLD